MSKVPHRVPCWEIFTPTLNFGSHKVPNENETAAVAVVSCEGKRYVKRLNFLSDAVFERVSFYQFFKKRYAKRLKVLSGAIFERGHFISFTKREFQLRLGNFSAVSCEEKRYVKRLKILSGAIFGRGPFLQFFQTQISAAFRENRSIIKFYFVPIVPF